MPGVGEEPVLRFIRKLAVGERCARLSDSELLQRFVNTRDDEAFAALVHRHGPMVLRVCLQVLGNEHDAEDAFQATFLVLSHKASSVKKRESIGSWLFGVANHAATDLKRKSARRRCHESKDVQPAVTDPLSALTLREAQAILNEELARLPEKYRAPLVLCGLEGLTRDETAKQLGLPLGTLKSRLEQARRQLRVRLAARGLTLSGAFAASVFSEQMASAALAAGLLNSTVQAATSVAPGCAANAIVSVNVCALAEGVIKTMLLTKIKTVSGLALAIALFASVAGLLMGQVLAARQTDTGTTIESKGGSPAQVPQDAPDQKKAAKPADLVNRTKAEEVQRRAEKKDQEPAVLEGSQGAIVAVAFSPDGKILAAGGGDFLYLWKVSTRELQFSFRGHGGNTVSCVAFSPDGKMIAVGAWDLKVWAADSGKELANLGRQRKGRAWPVVFAPDGKTLVTGYGETVKLWEVATWRERAALKGHERQVSSLAFAPDGKTLATGSWDGTVKLWEFATAKERKTLDLSKGDVTSVAFSPDGKAVAAGGGEGDVVVWEVNTGKVKSHLRGHKVRVTGVAFASDGKTLATSSYDKTVKIWDLATGKLLATLVGHPGEVQSVSFSPDGKKLASVSNGKEGTVRVWDVAKALRQKPD
jgi:RNA polymerase sigma factor (sigma-70 family)